MILLVYLHPCQHVVFSVIFILASHNFAVVPSSSFICIFLMSKELAQPFPMSISHWVNHFLKCLMVYFTMFPSCVAYFSLVDFRGYLYMQNMSLFLVLVPSIFIYPANIYVCTFWWRQTLNFNIINLSFLLSWLKCFVLLKKFFPSLRSQKELPHLASSCLRHLAYMSEELGQVFSKVWFGNSLSIYFQKLFQEESEGILITPSVETQLEII